MTERQYYKACAEAFVYIVALPLTIGWWTLAVLAVHTVYNIVRARKP